ncbi:hypothetical protein PoB_001565800 [Plakobranchus ocellatus]|uniref:Uncharacterized protein n=1 Tax=Plakobranchus ocellatus TaxID=259542 RepID=A0AAV3Z3U9_9GAST|nr:hypothetical protein PoB_001565800 [Plakobranchus ocellatus]
MVDLRLKRFRTFDIVMRSRQKIHIAPVATHFQFCPSLLNSILYRRPSVGFSIWGHHDDSTGPRVTGPVHNKVISGLRALRQAAAPVAGLEPATEGPLQISGRDSLATVPPTPLQIQGITNQDFRRNLETMNPIMYAK